MMSFAEVKESLYQKHFLNSSKSEDEVISSHWKKFGDYRVLKNSKGDFSKVSASAFGDFRKNSIFNKLRFFIELKSLEKIIPTSTLDPAFLKTGKSIAKSQERLFDFDCKKQISAITNISKKVNLSQINTFCVIGDGYGFLSSTLKSLYPNSSVINVNLGKTLFFDVCFSEKAHPGCSVNLLTCENSKITKGLNFLEAENYHVLKDLNIDIFLNIASFQEMDNSVIGNYFDFIKKSKAEKKLLYTCNRVSKKLPDGEVTQIDKYPWSGGKKILDQHCSWYDFFPLNRPPFRAKFDGVFKEKLYEFGRIE